MAVKKTQMYRRNLDGTETDLNPLTESQYVLMENGQTVQEVLSDRDSDKYTPVITNSSSTFKVGQGDNVDLSSSMKEGAYDSCVLKGKTMVNCIQESSSQDVVLPYEFEDGQYVTINDTKESGALGVELKGQTLVNLAKVRTATAYNRCSEKNISIKPNTKYIALFNPTYYEAESGVNYALLLVSSVSLNDNVVGGDDAYTKSVSGGLGSEYKPQKGDKHLIFTSKTNETYLHIRTGGNNGILYTDMMILEYQEGMENWDIPYFTGMTSCKMPILHTVGKNLFDIGKDTNHCWQGTTEFVDGRIKVTSTHNDGVTFHRTYNIPVKKGRTYIVNVNKEGNGHCYLWKNGDTTKKLNNPFTVDDTFDSVAIGLYCAIGEGNVCYFKPQIEEGTVATTYEAHKSSILSLPEEVVLRSLPNGVCDTFNTRTGEYIQRIGERILDGSESQWTNASISPTNVFELPMTNMKRYTGVGHIICDTLPYSYTNLEVWDTYTGVSPLAARENIVLRNNSTDTIQDLKAWLSQNPTTICYELATPVVTKINLSSTLKPWNTTTHIYSEIPENTLYPTLSHSNPTYPVILKPSTKYSIVANSYGNSHTNSAINFNLGGATASTTVGNRVTTITTPSTLSNELLIMSGRGNKLNNVMVIEGDVGGDEPYFEGICDCKSPILSNVGKNLLRVNDFIASQNGLTVVGDSKTNTITVNGTCSSDVYFYSTNPRHRLYYIENGFYSGSYTTSLTTTGVANTSNSIRGHVGHFAIRHEESGRTPCTMHFSQKSMTFTFDKFLPNGCWLRLDKGVVFDNYVIRIQFEANTSSTPYEPHKTNTTTFNQKDDKTIVLRSLPNGVCDTLNLTTGEYVQRIGDYTVNGTETSWFTYIDTTGASNNYLNQTSCAFGVHLTGKVKGNGILCDKLPTRSIGWWGGNHTGEGICGIDNDNRIFLRVKNEKTGVLYTDNVSTALGKAKTYFTNNPVTVQYELATPVVSTIDMQGFPYAYTNGHVQLSSGSIEQSLTPKVEYSLSANKTGQINSNTKRVSVHQKQLDDFEAMMLTQMVQSAYDKAILQFDYEMQMMSLGGE